MPQLRFAFQQSGSDEEALLRAQRGLPGDRPSLIREARLVLRQLNRAVVRKQPEYRDHLDRFLAIAAKFDQEDAGGLVRALAALPCKAPMWGQRGQFILIAAGCRMMIDWPAADVANLGEFDAYAIDFERPWLTATGYRGFSGWFRVAEEGRNVYAYVKRRVEQSRRRMIGGKWYVEPLEEIIESPFDDDEPGPPKDDPAWAEGGRIHEYLKANPAKRKA